MKFPIESIAVAVSAGAVNWLLNPKRKITELFVSMFLAAFAGYLVFLACRHYQVAQDLQSILCGVAGLSADNLLRAVKDASNRLALRKLDKITKG